jgi:hypothetical protein
MSPIIALREAPFVGIKVLFRISLCSASIECPRLAREQGEDFQLLLIRQG